MRAVERSFKAERQLAAWIDHLAEVAGEETAKRGNDAAHAKASGLARFSGHRRSRWNGYQEIALADWHNIIVFRVMLDRVIVVALYDMRQDLRRVRP